MPPGVSPRRRWPVLQGVLPFDTGRLPSDALAGITLAALGIPEVLGYSKIAGMPVVTGVYTILLPMAVFALLGSSRHLVVGADSATAAILAAGVATMAATGSPQYVGLAGLAALITGAMLLLARVVRLWFLANFLSRTVLVGFLTGVGIQVAVGQLPEMLGIDASGKGTVGKFLATVGGLSSTSAPTVVVSLAVIVLVVGVRRITRRVPGALIAVVGAIVAGAFGHLAAHGIRELGPVPRGLPHLGLPTLDARCRRRAARHRRLYDRRHPRPDLGDSPRLRRCSRRPAGTSGPGLGPAAILTGRDLKGLDEDSRVRAVTGARVSAPDEPRAEGPDRRGAPPGGTRRRHDTPRTTTRGCSARARRTARTS